MSYTRNGDTPPSSPSSGDLTDTVPATPSQSPPLTDTEPAAPAASPADAAAAEPSTAPPTGAAAAASAAQDPQHGRGPLNFEPRPRSGDIPVLRAGSRFPPGVPPRTHPAAPHRQGDQPPDDIVYFSARGFDDVLNWRGMTHKRIPGPCKDLCRDLGNEAARAAATGDHDSIKALIMSCLPA